jgi:hypothetical protein
MPSNDWEFGKGRGIVKYEYTFDGGNLTPLYDIASSDRILVLILNTFDIDTKYY